MCSEKQLEANRRNAQKSTGPRSAAGKLVTSQNALQHGLRGGADVLMPGEDPQPFEQLREQLERDLDPQGPIQRLLFDRILTGAWRLRRAHLIERGIFECDPRDSRDRARPYSDLLLRGFVFACGSADAMGKLARYENAIDRGMARALAELKRLQAARRGEQRADLTESVHTREKIAEQTHFQPQPQPRQ